MDIINKYLTFDNVLRLAAMIVFIEFAFPDLEYGSLRHIMICFGLSFMIQPIKESK